VFETLSFSDSPRYRDDRLSSESVTRRTGLTPFSGHFLGSRHQCIPASKAPDPRSARQTQASIQLQNPSIEARTSPGWACRTLCSSELRNLCRSGARLMPSCCQPRQHPASTPMAGELLSLSCLTGAPLMPSCCLTWQHPPQRGHCCLVGA